MPNDRTGGPAFPVTNVIVPQPGHFTSVPENAPGMSRLDYFATHAPAYPFKLPDISLTDSDDPTTKIASEIAKWNYAYARAMLKERG